MIVLLLLLVWLPADSLVCQRQYTGLWNVSEVKGGVRFLYVLDAGRLLRFDTVKYRSPRLLATEVENFTIAPGNRLFLLFLNPPRIEERTTMGRLLRIVGQTSAFTYTEETTFPSIPIDIEVGPDGELLMLGEDGLVYRLHSGSFWEPYLRPPERSSYRRIQRVGSTLILWGEHVLVQYDRSRGMWDVVEGVDAWVSVASGTGDVIYVVYPRGIRSASQKVHTNLTDLRVATFWRGKWWVGTSHALYACTEAPTTSW